MCSVVVWIYYLDSVLLECPTKPDPLEQLMVYISFKDVVAWVLHEIEMYRDYVVLHNF